MQAEQASALTQLPIIPYILIFFIFYFLVLKPQKEKQKEHANMLANLKKNDEVITVGGIHGKVVMIKDDTVILRVDDNVRIEFNKDAITSVKNKNNS